MKSHKILAISLITFGLNPFGLNPLELEYHHVHQHMGFGQPNPSGSSAGLGGFAFEFPIDHDGAVHFERAEAGFAFNRLEQFLRFPIRCLTDVPIMLGSDHVTTTRLENPINDFTIIKTPVQNPDDSTHPLGSQGAGHGLNGDPDFFAFAHEFILERTVSLVVQKRSRPLGAFWDQETLACRSDQYQWRSGLGNQRLDHR